jgi:hypothetical protein
MNPYHVFTRLSKGGNYLEIEYTLFLQVSQLLAPCVVNRTSIPPLPIRKKLDVELLMMHGLSLDMMIFWLVGKSEKECEKVHSRA